MLEDCVRNVRDMALLLRPSMLDDLGLIAALRWQARELTRRSQLNVRMVTEEIDDDLPDAYRTCVYRVVQEALPQDLERFGACQRFLAEPGDSSLDRRFRRVKSNAPQRSRAPTSAVIAIS